jgi:SAM-dependent methyltransferase
MRNRANSPRMQIERAAEAFSPPGSDVQLVLQCAERIADALGQERPDWFDYYVRNHSPRIAFDLGLVRTWFSQGSVVADFGSSPLLLTAALAALDFRVVGVDLDPSRFDRASRAMGLDVVRCDIERERLPFEDNSFDGVVFNEIFEHLRIDPIATFAEIRRVLRPRGRLLLSTPNGASFSNLRNLLIFDRGLDNGVYESFDALRTVGHMGHVREYTLSDVVEFLSSAGFECLRATFRGRYPTNFGQLAARLVPRLRPHFTVVACKPASGSNQVAEVIPRQACR